MRLPRLGSTPMFESSMGPGGSPPNQFQGLPRCAKFASSASIHKVSTKGMNISDLFFVAHSGFTAGESALFLKHRLICSV